MDSNINALSSVIGSKKPVDLSQYDAIGFDVDHTLIKYKIKNLVQLVYRGFAQTLVEEKGFPADLLELTEDEAKFASNGLTIDQSTGLIIKLGENKTILRAYYGFQRLTTEQILAIFKDGKLNNFMEWIDMPPEGYLTALTFFGAPYMILYAKMQEYKKKGITKKNNNELFED